MLLTHGCEIRELETSGLRMIKAERHWEKPPADLISQLRASAWVENVIHSGSSYPLIASGERETVRVGSAAFGEAQPVLVAGPCTIESPEILLETARAVKAAGAKVLRGGAFKPTTSPYSFGGHAEEGLLWLTQVRAEVGIAVVTEVMDTRMVGRVSEAADMLQIGARNMQNFELLREVGRQTKPVLLKRSFGARIDEWLCAAEYIASEGNTNIVLCERGIRTFETTTRATLDLAAICAVHDRSRLPVIVDPSHAAGNRDFVCPLALAAIAAGADGLMIEVHPHPEQSIKDGAQTISTEAFASLSAQISAVSGALGKAAQPVR